MAERFGAKLTRRGMILMASLAVVALAACGGNGGGGGDGGSTAVCNPVTQAGCEAGEKCAQLVQSDDPFLASTACVPDGSVTDGGACTRGAAGQATGYDDCVAGFD